MRRAIKIVLLLLAIGMATVAFGDGSDPMPLCRPSQGRQCPQ